MSKFKAGDKVKRTAKTYGKAIKGGVYEVSEVSSNYYMNSYGINLKGHEGVSGKFVYEASGFELYIDDILTPLEAAEAMLKDKDIEFLSEFSGQWIQVGRPYSKQSLSRLSEYKLRIKPKIIIINGVEVPAPSKKEDIKNYFYILDVSEEVVHEADKIYISNNKNFWATREDAQKVLDAILIPFNSLSEGE